MQACAIVRAVKASLPEAAQRPLRYGRLDASRGFAVVWMALFHFAFDLAHFGFTRQNFYADAFWTVQRSIIVSLFLLCAGIGQAIAHEQRLSWPRFWRRWGQVAACALLVTVATLVMFPKSYISFGVLHGLAVMLLVARFSAGWGLWLWPLGLVALVLPQLVADPFFDTRATHWIGLVTRKPVTEDFVPVLPWLGVLWWGMALGRWLLARRRLWLAGALPRGLAPLALLGRWSLSVYMLHQPVLIGLLMAAVWLRSF